jgi:hypothetical protein
MILDFKLLPVAVAYMAGVLLLPGVLAWLVLLASLFVAGCLFPARPVAAATSVTGLTLVPCALLLAFTEVSWFTSGWHRYYPVKLELEPATLFGVGDLLVRAFTTWGWAVVAAYMGAATVLRRKLQAARLAGR